jgi:hypothetical protein
MNVKYILEYICDARTHERQIYTNNCFYFIFISICAVFLNPSKAIHHLLASLEAHHILYVSGIRVKCYMFASYMLVFDASLLLLTAAQNAECWSSRMCRIHLMTLVGRCTTVL